MNETLLIVLGVSVFAMTVVAVLIYFYSLFDRLAKGNVSATAADPDV